MSASDPNRTLLTICLPDCLGGIFHWNSGHSNRQRRGKLADREVQRRLAAIVAADVAGYTRLMEEDSEGTVAAWQDDRIVKTILYEQ